MGIPDIGIFPNFQLVRVQFPIPSSHGSVKKRPAEAESFFTNLNDSGCAYKT
jgi:hypothetical protein